MCKFDKLNKKIIFLFIYILIISFCPAAYAESTEETVIKPPEVVAASAILIDQDSGQVLYAKDESKKMFPASTTKILTALVALQYLSPNDFVVIGNELNYVPNGSSLARHIPGETLRVDNLIRGLMIPSGNDSSCVVAMAVAKKYSEDEGITYPEAENVFSKLMNDKAKELGANNSNFENPHGFHSDKHYTTAYDMALITKAALNNELIKEIVQEKEFVGTGAGENPDPAWITQKYTNWKTHNELLVPGEGYYQYATGVKTGLTDEAGYCLVASATKDDKNFISVVFFSTEADRAPDTIKIFNYGFDAYKTEIIQESGITFAELKLDNPRLGTTGTIIPYSKETFSAFMNKDQLSRVKQEIEYNNELLVQDEEISSGELMLKVPISKDQVIGKVSYFLDNNLLFTADVLSMDEALERTFSSDVDYRINLSKSWLFSPKSIPYVLGAIGVITLLVIIITLINKRRRRRRRGFSMRW